jgi:hypothetical protein
MAQDEIGDLAEFIRDTLTQIKQGIEAANEGAQSGEKKFVMMYSAEDNIQFDVAVTVSGSTEGGGKAGVKVLGMEIGGGGEINRGSERVSRIQFVVYPPTAGIT